MDVPSSKATNALYNNLISLGDFFSTDIFFEYQDIVPEIERFNDHWQPYNKSKTNFNRWGLSLFSLNGEMDGKIDLNSVREYNETHSTNYNELSFRTPTKAWKDITSLSKPLKSLEPYLGRSHFIRFDNGGFFPPHRDLGNSFRLISFINCNHESVYLTLEDKILPISCGRLYFFNTRKRHSIMSFDDNNIILVLNVEISTDSTQWVLDNLLVT